MQHEQSHPIIILQSVANSELSFLTAPVETIDPHYRLELSPDDRGELGLPEADEPGAAGVACLAILTVGEEGCVTANLMSPIVINRAQRRAVQVIQSRSGYSHRHPLVLEGKCS